MHNYIFEEKEEEEEQDEVKQPKDSQPPAEKTESTGQETPVFDQSPQKFEDQSIAVDAPLQGQQMQAPAENAFAGGTVQGLTGDQYAGLQGGFH